MRTAVRRVRSPERNGAESGEERRLGSARVAVCVATGVTRVSHATRMVARIRLLRVVRRAHHWRTAHWIWFWNLHDSNSRAAELAGKRKKGETGKRRSRAAMRQEPRTIVNCGGTSWVRVVQSHRSCGGRLLRRAQRVLITESSTAPSRHWRDTTGLTDHKSRARLKRVTQFAGSFQATSSSVLAARRASSASFHAGTLC